MRLHYDGAARAATDVPDTVGKLVKQRRRWLNGSFFATIYAVGNWGRTMRGNRHGPLQRLRFAALFLWNILNMFLAWCVRRARGGKSARLPVPDLHPAKERRTGSL